MTSTSSLQSVARLSMASRLRNLYFVRAAFSALWVTLMLLVGIRTPQIGALLVVLYPAWDVLATAVEIRMQGRAPVQLAQYLNVASSILATIGFGVALNTGQVPLLIMLFGIWAVVTGLIQLGVGIARRRALGGQWAIIVSGAQSSIAGIFFIMMANTPTLGLSSLAGYSAVGAIYFLVSAIRLTLHPATQHRAHPGETL